LFFCLSGWILGFKYRKGLSIFCPWKYFIWWGGVRRWSKVSFNFFHFEIFLTKTYINLYNIKKCPDKCPMGFKFWSSWGSEHKKSKTPSGVDFFEISLKLDFVKKNSKDFPVKRTQIKFKGNYILIFARSAIYLLRIFNANLKAI